MKETVLVIFILLMAVAGIAAAATDPIGGGTTVGGDKGYYSVSSSPGGGSVVFDGTGYGTTPVTIPVSTTGSPGHTLSVSKSGYQTWSQYYPGNPGKGQTISITANLVPVAETGSISVLSSPSGASAVLDNGYDQMTTPGTFRDVNAGWHNVLISKPGYTPYTTNVLVAAGQTASVSATLVKNQQVGSISVSSNPLAASLYVDSIYQGLTNQIVSNLGTGTHTVLLKKSGYKDSKTQVVVNANQITPLSITLTPVTTTTTGDLDVRSTPSGASVYLNNDYQGETPSGDPLYLTGLAAGTYTVVLKKPAYQDYSTTTTITAGSTQQVTATLQPSQSPSNTASVEVVSVPSGADVYIDNVYRGITPLSFENVPIDPAKTYTVTLKMEGYNTYTSSGTLQPGQVVQIHAALTQVAKPPEPESFNPIWLIAGGVLVIIVIAAIAFFIIRKRKQDPGESP